MSYDFFRLKNDINDLISDKIVHSNIIPKVILFGQKKLEDLLLLEGISLPLLEASYSYTPYLAINTNYIPIPSDYLQLIHLQITDQIYSPEVTLSSTTGTLAANTYYYRVTATNANGETLGSNEQSIVLSATGGVTLNWTAVTGATGYKVYGRATGAELYIATISSGTTVTYTDSGAITPSGAMPVANTTGKQKYEIIEKINPTKFADTELLSIDASRKGRPDYCTRVSSNWIFDMYADKSYAYDLRYYKRISDLSDTVITNYWTDNHYMPLFWCSIVESLPFMIKEEPRMEMWVNKMNTEIAIMKKRNYYERFKGNRDKLRTSNPFIV